MNLLVTGGAGFLGSHFVRSALSGAFDDVLPTIAASRITVLDKLTRSGTFGALGPVAENSRLDFVPGDVGDADLVDNLVSRVDAIVHLAALGVTEVAGTQMLLDAAVRHGTGRFVQVSTGEVYGPAGAAPAVESTPLAPVTPHAAAKAAADLLALAAHRTHGLPVVITRGADTYGPFQHPEKLVPGLVTDLLRGRTTALPGDGRTVRDRVHADDHSRGLALALAKGTPGEVYHLGGTPGWSDRDVAGRILKLCDAGWHRVTTGAAGPEQRYALDDTRARDELGYLPRVDLDAGLESTVRWYRDNEPWWRSLV